MILGLDERMFYALFSISKAWSRRGPVMAADPLFAFVERALAGAGTFQIGIGDLTLMLGPYSNGGFVVSVKRPVGPVGEREAVDLVVRVHRLLDRAGCPLEPEMFAYRGPERSRCFVLATCASALA